MRRREWCAEAGCDTRPVANGRCAAHQPVSLPAPSLRPHRAAVQVPEDEASVAAMVVAREVRVQARGSNGKHVTLALTPDVARALGRQLGFLASLAERGTS